MSGGVISYEITSHTAKELTDILLRAVQNDRPAIFSAISLDSPEQVQKPTEFRVKVQTVHAGDPMIFDVDVIDSAAYWTRIEVYENVPVRFDLIP